MNPNSDVAESTKFYNELGSVVKRWMDEGDQLTVFEILGALDAVHADVLDCLKEHNEKEKQ